VNFNSSLANTIIVETPNGLKFFLDEITVSTPNDLAKANPHRRALNLAQQDLDDLMAYLLQLDGSSVDIPAGNVPPTADAGPDQTVIDSDGDGAEDVTLDGSGSDDSDGNLVSYVWEKNSLQIATGVNPVVSLAVGIHTIDLTATDDQGATASDTVNVAVSPQNDAPVIDQTGPLVVTMDEDGSPTAFVAPTITATDDDGDSLTWSGSAATSGTSTVSGTGPSPTINYVPTADFNGGDSFDVTVSDGSGGSDTITVNVTVNPQNDAPRQPLPQRMVTGTR
jgi:hypothetical protein